MIITCGPVSRPGGEVKKGCWDYWKEDPGYKLPESGHVLAPWVAISFIDQSNPDTPAVTVSNHSSPSTDPEHAAVIKSFTFGHQDGTKATVLIHDVQGGNFEAFMRHLTKDWVCIKGNLAGIWMKLSFGWTKSNCKMPDDVARSQCYYLVVDSIETNFSEGKFIFDVTGIDLGPRVFEGATEFEKGGEGQEAVYLMDAAKQYMCNHQAPNFGNVDFRRIENGITLSSNKGDKIFWSPTNDPQEEIKGLKMKYVSHGRDKIHTLRAWASQNSSYGTRRGFHGVYDPTKPNGGEIVFWELQNPECNLFNPELHLGTYIVNGSKSSPVIEFNPKIRWNFSSVTSTGGNQSDQKALAFPTDGSKNPGHKCLPREQVDGAGGKTETHPTDGEGDRHGSRNVVESGTNDHTDKKTTRIDAYENIGADLVVVGDPTLPDPVMSKNYFVSIVVINPFAIVPNRGSKCGEWMSGPVCNAVLSNNAWMVHGISHTIEAGKYTSTITVNLPTPGTNLASYLPLGASPKGWKPPAC